MIMINKNYIKLTAAGEKCWREWLKTSCATCNKRVQDHHVSRGPRVSRLLQTHLIKTLEQQLVSPEDESWRNKVRRAPSFSCAVENAEPLIWMGFYRQLTGQTLVHVIQKVRELAKNGHDGCQMRMSSLWSLRLRWTDSKVLCRNAAKARVKNNKATLV